MVEVNWAAGRVVRDYTFLLDPPGSQARDGRRSGHARARRARASAPPQAPAPPRRLRRRARRTARAGAARQAAITYT